MSETVTTSKQEHWTKRMTPEQRKAWVEKMTSAKRANPPTRTPKARITNHQTTGIKINVTEVTKGRYQKGSSRTLIVTGVPWSSDETRAQIARLLKDLKERGVKQPTVKVGVVTL